MNKQRRKNIQEVIDKLNECLESISCFRDEEQEYFDGIPENLRDGEKASAAEEAISRMEDADTALQDSISALEDAINT